MTAKKKKGGSSSRQQQQAAAAARRGGGIRSGGGRGATQPPAPPAPSSAPATPSTGRQPDRVYLDVSAVHIQHWLARTPDLKGWRGASALLSVATSRDTWTARMPARMRWNDEAGDLDGVVSLCTDDDVDAQQAQRCVELAAAEVVAALRAQMPAVTLQAVHGGGQSYAEAYATIERCRADGDLLLDAPPAPPEVVLAKPCDSCRSYAASRSGVHPAAGKHVCRDCAARYDTTGGTKGDWRVRSPRAERRLLAVLNAPNGDGPAQHPVVGFPDDFNGLAEAGRVAADDAPTQVTLIYADGNRVGAFLHKAAEHARAAGTPDKADIVAAIDSATQDALADMVRHLYPGEKRPPVLAHVAGGDDVMVSVPARDGWRAASTLLTQFGRRLAGHTTKQHWPAALTKSLPSMSAGLVFHHRSAPFPDVVQLTKGRLAAAKQHTNGEHAALAFLDLTVDGATPPDRRPAFSVAALQEQTTQLGRVAALAASHRATLLTLLRRAQAEEAIGVHEDDEPAQAALARRVVDLGARVLWEIVAGRDAGADTVAATLRGDPAARTRLRTALEVARYWPPTKEVRG